jgi:phospholipase D1/2
MYLAIQAAKHFIYVTGWAVWPELEMLRERPLDGAGFPTLGQMLKKKADEGVTVCY